MIRRVSQERQPKRVAVASDQVKYQLHTAFARSSGSSSSARVVGSTNAARRLCQSSHTRYAPKMENISGRMFGNDNCSATKWEGLLMITRASTDGASAPGHGNASATARMATIAPA